MTLDDAILDPVLFRIAMRYTRDREKALDLVNDTIVRALAYRDKFDGRNALAWLTVVMRNHHIEQARRLRSKREIYQADVFDHRMVAPPQLAEVDLKQVVAAIHTLEPLHRDILLTLAAGLNYEDIVEQLGLPLGTVKSKIHRARAALNRKLEARNSGTDNL